MRPRTTPSPTAPRRSPAGTWTPSSSTPPKTSTGRQPPLPALDQRWHDRAAALGTPAFVTTDTGKRTSWIVAFPEAVALTAILTDLKLRRHVALEWDDRPLYRRIAASIGEQHDPAWAYHDPVRRWTRIHRARFEQLRYGAWRKPLPPPERFK